MKESSLWSWMDRGTRHLREHIHMNRTENVAGEGTPDVEGCLDGRCFAIELKVADRPKRRTTRITTQSPIKTTQIEWLEDRRRAGGNAWLLIQVGDHHQARRYLLDGMDAQKALDGLTEDEMDNLCVLDPRANAESLIRTAAYTAM